MAKAAAKIPAELAKELRALTHDLSNALETILQAAYLVSQGGAVDDSRRWMAMIDEATRQAVKINQKLRQTLREQS